MFSKGIRRGLKYAVILMIVSAIMGLIYGLLGGLFFRSALVAVTFVGIFAVANLALSALTWIPLLLFTVLKKSTRILETYAGISLGFVIIYLPFFILLKYLPFSPFE